MTRQNFSKAQKVEIIKRATRDSVTYCEKCKLPAKKWEIDHIIACALGGTNDLSNARLLCLPCHREEKTPQDVANIAKAKRREARHLGVKKDGPKLKSRGFQKSSKEPRICKPALPPRQIYTDE